MRFDLYVQSGFAQLSGMKTIVAALSLTLLLQAKVHAAEIRYSFDNLKVRNSSTRILSKGMKGEGIRVAFIGGSITANVRGHSSMVPELLAEQLPDSDIVVINAGLSSTCSTSGAFRLEEHVLAHGPLDLLVVEFAVNDDQDARHSRRDCIRGMEGIVRHVRQKSPQTEIIIVYFLNEAMMSDLQAGRTPIPISAHEQVAKHYSISSVNVAAEVAASIKTGTFTWKDYGGTHPNEFGYLLASKMIVGAIAGAWDRSDLPAVADRLPEPIGDYHYGNGRFIPVSKAELHGKWRTGKVGRELLPTGGIRSTYESYDLLHSDRVGDSLRIEFTGKAIGAFILAGPDAGFLSSSIDGESLSLHDLYHRYSRKLNYPRSVIFAAELSPGKHLLELSVAAQTNAQSSGNAVNILFFEVN